MISFGNRLSLAMIVGLSLVAGSGGTAMADKRLVCSMKGTWVETQDEFLFNAEYFAKGGPDTFRGIHVGTSTGAMANVEGAADGDSWTIKVEYTDKERRGQVMELVGAGKGKGSAALSIEGQYTHKKEGQPIGRGKFVLIGKCR